MSEWKDTLKQMLNDKRLVGTTLAGLGGAALGAGVLPGLIYKKPTGASRAAWGGVTGAATALAALAYMSALGEREVPEKISQAAKNVISAGRQTFDALTGSRPTRRVLDEMEPLGRAMYGVQNPGGPISGGFSWLVRNIKRGLPDKASVFGKSQTDKAREQKGLETPTGEGSWLDALRGAFNVGASTGVGVLDYKKSLRNWQSRQRVKELIQLLDGKGGAVDKVKLRQLKQNLIGLKDFVPSKPNGLTGIRARLKHFTSPAIKSTGTTLKNNLLGGYFGDFGRAIKSKWTGKDRISYNPNVAGRQNSALFKYFTNTNYKGALDQDTLKAVRELANKSYTPSVRRRLGYGLKGGAKGLLTMMLLGNLESMMGANKSYDDYVAKAMAEGK